MAARLTDRQKKKIVADYVQIGSYRAVARLNKVSYNTVKRVVLECDEIEQKITQKKEENTADIIAYMESQRNDVCEVLEICLGALKKPERYEKTPPQQIATTMAILIDKYTAINGSSVGDDESEDALSKSLREIGKELESDV